MRTFRVALTLSALGAFGAWGGPPLELPKTKLDSEQQALHVLNRLAYGPSPRDLIRVREEGPAKWIAEQLEPNSISDPEVELKLLPLKTLTLSTAEALAQYPDVKMAAKREGVDLKDPGAQERMRAEIKPEDRPRELGRELIAARLIRAVASERQLQEVLLDFWFNHFNVSADKGVVRWMLTSYERDALRPNLFGNFRDLLGAVAHHPAMLFYLDNFQSTRDGFVPKKGKRARQVTAAAGMPITADESKPPVPEQLPASGLNENYGRELLELHTLGVEGGYTQEDVREVARCFTGWSIEKPREVGEFMFRPQTHDPGGKVVMGYHLSPGGGIEDGEKVLDVLVEEPATAKFIAKKLAQKFVMDDPPKALVERVARAFHESHGNLKATYVALFTSPEFWSPAAYRAKTKTPLELAVSAVRALGGTTDGDVALAQRIEQMGEALYRDPPPTGYPEIAAPWVNAGALVNRVNFGLALASRRVRGVDLTLPHVPANPAETVEVISRAILHEQISATTRRTLLNALETPADPAKAGVQDAEKKPADPQLAVGLLLGSPEFQKQ